jgi:protein-disulfide isomerase
VKSVAKSEKKAAAQAGSGKGAKDKSSSGEAATAKDVAGGRNLLFIVGAAAAALLVGVFVYWQATKAGSSGTGEKTDPGLAELMAPGPLPDMVLGKPDAPNVIVEYASMTCPHCAQFHTTVLPELQTKYIDTGQAKLILREFPLDGLAVAAFMLARCAGPDRYYPMVSALFETQKTWATQGPEGKEKLLLIAKQAGFTKEKFDQCVGDKELFNKIVETRAIGNEQFGVDSTPHFFVNGKRLTGEHTLQDFEAALSGKPKPEAGTTPAPEGSATPAPEGGTTPMPDGSENKPEGSTGQ